MIELTGWADLPEQPLMLGRQTGTLWFSIPAVQLPGRGLDLNLNLVYNSRLWQKAGNEMLYDADGGWPAPGWNLGFGRMIFFYGTTGGCMLIDPDGTRRSYAGNRQTYNQNGYYQETFTGYTSSGSIIDYGCVYTDSPLPEFPYSNITLTGYAKLSNGTTITYNATRNGGLDQIFPTRIEDAEGNYIDITYVDGYGPDISTITDTLGRVITFNYNGNAQLTSIAGPARSFLSVVPMQINLDLTNAFASGIQVYGGTFNSAQGLRAVCNP